MSELRDFVKKLEQRFAANPEMAPEPLEQVLKGQAIELWSTSAGRLFLVADEADARQAIERFGVRRGEIYTAAEARRIIAVKDPAIVAEIHDWKLRFDGVGREFRAGDHHRFSESGHGWAARDRRSAGPASSDRGGRAPRSGKLLPAEFESRQERDRD